MKLQIISTSIYTEASKKEFASCSTIEIGTYIGGHICASKNSQETINKKVNHDISFSEMLERNQKDGSFLSK